MPDHMILPPPPLPVSSTTSNNTSTSPTTASSSSSTSSSSSKRRPSLALDHQQQQQSGSSWLQLGLPATNSPMELLAEGGAAPLMLDLNLGTLHPPLPPPPPPAPPNTAVTASFHRALSFPPFLNQEKIPLPHHYQHRIPTYSGFFHNNNNNNNNQSMGMPITVTSNYNYNYNYMNMNMMIQQSDIPFMIPDQRTATFLPPVISGSSSSSSSSLIIDSTTTIKLIHPTTSTTITTHSAASAGLWFLLEPFLHNNQSGQGLLPQLPKSFLRIKDGRMTVSIVIKYLTKKLGVDIQSHKVEIRCKGQELEPYLTLQHVRDQIWSQSEAVTLLPNSTTSPHLMLLHYACYHRSPPIPAP